MRGSKEQLHHEMKQKFVLERLLKMGVRQSQSGKSLHECDYETLKYELVLASFREIDVEHDLNRWY